MTSTVLRLLTSIRLLASTHRDADRERPRGRPDEGMTTAELLGNAALGIAALVAIWAVLQTLGLDVVDWIRAQLIT
ncbi:MAG TPA: hypothetical protein VFZ17_07090 [Acidimicrobiia bacterium]|nr:hypothetical protein [Acidimicrobiia bacterium]